MFKINTPHFFYVRRYHQREEISLTSKTSNNIEEKHQKHHVEHTSSITREENINDIEKKIEEIEKKIDDPEKKLDVFEKKQEKK